MLLLNDKITKFLEMIRQESNNQNLVSRKTLEHLYEYHVEDSLELAKKISPSEVVIDVGSGAGFPGIIVALHGVKHIHLVEPRKLRAEFLQTVIDAFELDATVHCQKIHQLDLQHDTVITRGTGSLRWLLTNVPNAKRVLAIKSSNYLEEVQDLTQSSKSITSPFKLNTIIPIKSWNAQCNVSELSRGVGVIVELTNIECKRS